MEVVGPNIGSEKLLSNFAEFHEGDAPRMELSLDVFLHGAEEAVAPVLDICGL